METTQVPARITCRPLEVTADKKTRLQIPAMVRKMIKAGPNSKFYLHVTQEGDLYFSKAEK